MNNTYTKNILFSTPIFQFQNKDLALQLKKYILLKKIEGIESDIAPRMKHNLAESKFDFFNNENEIIHSTGRYIAACLTQALNDVQNEDCSYTINFYESWYHIGNKNSTHDTHTHGNCSWCGIFYLQSGDIDSGGETVFNNPIQSNYGDYGSFQNAESHSAISPEDGKLVLFPSYLQHSQSLYTGNEDRIVVAFNCKIIDKIIVEPN